MEKKFEDDELNKWLDEQSMKEAELIEQALFSDDSFEDYEETDEELKASYQRLVERLKADGIYREEDDGQTGSSDSYGGNEADKEKEQSGGSHSIDTAAAEETGDKIVSLPVSDRTKEKRKAGRTYKIAKAAGFVVVGTLCVFAASMTSEANRSYFIKTIDYFIGSDTKIDIDNLEGSVAEGKEEFEAINDIERILDIEIPEFMYRPNNFKFSGYSVDTTANMASVEYMYGNMIISMQVDKKSKNSASGNFSLHGNKVTTTYIKEEDIKVNILEVRDKQDVSASYVAQWERDNIFFQVSGKMEEEEFINLIQNIMF